MNDQYRWFALHLSFTDLMRFPRGHLKCPEILGTHTNPRTLRCSWQTIQIEHCYMNILSLYSYECVFCHISCLTRSFHLAILTNYRPLLNRYVTSRGVRCPKYGLKKYFSLQGEDLNNLEGKSLAEFFKLSVSDLSPMLISKWF